MSIAAAARAITEPEIRAVRRMDTAVELELVPPRLLLFFVGHFPGYAILPGVVQVDWALLFGRRHLGFATAPVRTVQVKFRKLIRPDTVLTLSLSAAAAGQRLAFTYRSAQGICSSGQLGL